MRFLSPVRPHQREVHATLASSPGPLAGLQPQHPCQQLLVTAGEPGAGGGGQRQGRGHPGTPQRTARHRRCWSDVLTLSVFAVFRGVPLARESGGHACERSRCRPQATEACRAKRTVSAWPQPICCGFAPRGLSSPRARSARLSEASRGSSVDMVRP